MSSVLRMQLVKQALHAATARYPLDLTEHAAPRPFRDSAARSKRGADVKKEDGWSQESCLYLKDFLIYALRGWSRCVWCDKSSQMVAQRIS